MSLEDKAIFINSINDLTICVSLASSLELAGWPKPGNVHRTANFETTRFEHFLTGIAAIQPNFRDFCKKTYRYSVNIGEDYSFVKLGNFFKEAASELMKWQKGGNVLFGHLLILAPLAAAGAICLKAGKQKFKHFAFNVKKIIDDSTVYDTVNLYEAIKICKVGGLGKIEKYDVNDGDSIKKIKSDKITLKNIFEFSKEYDTISLEYATGFKIVLNEGLPFYLNEFNRTKDINATTVNTFLKILSEHPDTLIARKSGMDEALSVSDKALEIVRNGGISTERGLELTKKLDVELQSKKGKANPGTTADLIAGVIFCALLLGLRF